VIVRGTLVSAGNGQEPGHVKDRPSSTFQMRVVGGRTLTNAELGGYIVALFYFDGFVCGGTLIQDRIVLTAAHCLKDREKKYGWDIYGGISRLPGSGERRKVKDFVISPDFRPNEFDSDVAIMLLNKVIFGKNIGKVSLCTTKLTEGMPLAVSGWGSTKDETVPDSYLRTVTVPHIEWNKCRETFREIDVNITSNMLCAGVPGSKDACIYDSGGPLIYQKEICGIVSFGIGCAHIKFPGVYTDVLSVKPFIEQSIKRL
ncbi:hypothetical protein KR032_002626, partial [Drosophila birchii]